MIAAPENEFVGALCIDLIPVGPISDYFHFPNDTSSYYLTDAKSNAFNTNKKTKKEDKKTIKIKSES